VESCSAPYERGVQVGSRGGVVRREVGKSGSNDQVTDVMPHRRLCKSLRSDVVNDETQVRSARWSERRMSRCIRRSEPEAIPAALVDDDSIIGAGRRNGDGLGRTGRAVRDIDVVDGRQVSPSARKSSLLSGC